MCVAPSLCRHCLYLDLFVVFLSVFLVFFLSFAPSLSQNPLGCVLITPQSPICYWVHGGSQRFGQILTVSEFWPLAYCIRFSTWHLMHRDYMFDLILYPQRFLSRCMLLEYLAGAMKKLKTCMRRCSMPFGTEPNLLKHISTCRSLRENWCIRAGCQFCALRPTELDIFSGHETSSAGHMWNLPLEDLACECLFAQQLSLFTIFVNKK